MALLSSVMSAAKQLAPVLSRSLVTPMGAVAAMQAARSLKSAHRPYSGVPAEAPQEDREVTLTLPSQFKGHNIEPPSTTVTTSKGELLHLYEDMFRMRRMEIAVDGLYKAKLIRGFCHLYDGQEAVSAGMERVITPDDAVITSYRAHCVHLGRGGTAKEVLAELMGHEAGMSIGKGGSMHMYRGKTHFYGGNGIVGAQTPLGVGVAFSMKYQKTPNVCITMYGDGAANQGQLYEAMNIAALWNLPCIFVCENNHYGLGTSDKRAAKNIQFYSRGDYVPGIWVDGMDPLAVKQATSFAKDYVLKNGPLVLEMDTYRYHGHSMSDPGSTYRTRDEVSSMRQSRDCVERVKKYLTDLNLADSKEIKAIENQVKKELDDDMEQAKASPFPPAGNLWKDVYVNTNMGNFKIYGVDRKTTSVVP